MFKKFKLKTLLILFAVLLAIVVISKIIESRKGDRSFKSELVILDTTEVTEIEIVSQRGGIDQIKILKIDDVWNIEKEGKQYIADQSVVQSVLSELVNLKPQRVAATNKSMWKKFEVTDSLAVRVIAKKKSKILVDVLIGKFLYKKPDNPYQRQGTMISYVRLADEEKVFAVNGFLNMSFSRDINTYRDKSVINNTKDDWTKLHFASVDTIPFTLTKQNDKWMIDGLLADSAKVEDYFKSINNLRSYDFVENNTVLSASNTLVIEGNNMPASIKIEAFQADTINQYIITSSINKGAAFSGSKADLFKKIFVNREQFLIEE